MEDLRDMIAGNIQLFESDNDDYKPVLIKSVDGGPDENPRFEKNILAACQVKKKYKFDAVIEVTNAPGLSAFNRVERRIPTEFVYGWSNTSSRYLWNSFGFAG